MSHWSEDSCPLEVREAQPHTLAELVAPVSPIAPQVYFFHFPAGRQDMDAGRSRAGFEALAAFCGGLHNDATVCIYAAPSDAARLLPFLQSVLKFQLWIAVKAPAEVPAQVSQLPRQHNALLVLTRYKGSLRHTKTRIGYTYCPICGKTTKDYGGKKHVYHEYGTLMSDVWRDIECSLSGNVSPVVDRLRDMFGLAPYSTLYSVDLSECAELKPVPALPLVREPCLPLAEFAAAPPRAELINGDCLTALRGVPSDSIDFCFADPPYNVKKQYDHWNDAMEMQEYFAWCDAWLSELMRVLKPGRTLAVLNIPLWAVRHCQHLATLGQFQSWIVWEALSFPVRMIMPAHYAIVCFSKGEPRPLPGLTAQELTQAEKQASTPLGENLCIRGGCVSDRRRNPDLRQGNLSDLWHDIHRLKHNSRRVDHPCQLPPALMRRLFALFTRSQETILDCFNGAGTSTLVAHQMGRGYVGMELSAEYHRIAGERHAQIEQGEDPFGRQETMPKAKNSPVARLPKQQYAVSKKVLQLDVRRIAQELGRLPTREEVAVLSPYPIMHYDEYFFSWGEVCAAARTTGMSEMPANQNETIARTRSLFAEMSE